MITDRLFDQLKAKTHDHDRRANLMREVFDELSFESQVLVIFDQLITKYTSRDEVRECEEYCPHDDDVKDVVEVEEGVIDRRSFQHKK